MANWRKTKRIGKFTITQNSSGKSSTSQRVVSSPNLNINHRYTSRGTIVRKTWKSGGWVKVEQSSNMAKRPRKLGPRSSAPARSSSPAQYADLKTISRSLENAAFNLLAIISAPFFMVYYLAKFTYYGYYYLVFIPYKYFVFIPLIWLIKLLFPRTINDINLKIKELKETMKTGRDKFKKNMKNRWDKFKKNIAIR